MKRNVVAMARKGRIVNVELDIELPDLHVAFAVVYIVYAVDVGSEHAVEYTVVKRKPDADADVSVHVSEKIVDDYYCSSADCIDTAADYHSRNRVAFVAAAVYDPC